MDRKQQFVSPRALIDQSAGPTASRTGLSASVQPPTQSPGLPLVSIGSLNGSDYVGGLAAYQRFLRSGLMDSGIEVRMVGTEAKGAKRWQRLVPLMRRLASRPRWHFILEVIVRVATPPGIRAKPLGRFCHYVGTGWDFVGFALLQTARRQGAGFSVWPAVHPGQWGDDHIDLLLYNQADVVFCQSDHEADHLVARGLDRAKVVRCGLPPMCRPDGNGVRLREKLRIQDRPAVLFVGRRDQGKGYPALLAAWRLVHQACPEAVLLLIGPKSGGGPENLSESILDLGTADEITKADALAACDIFCLPSAHESFGIVYVEAWSYEKPVICGPAPASRELVANEVTGLWAEQSAESIAAQLLRLLNDRRLARQFGAAGLQLQREHYTAGRMLQAHLDAWHLASQLRSP